MSDPLSAANLTALGALHTLYKDGCRWRLVAGGIDLVRDLHPSRPREMIQLGLQPVVCLLGKPGDVVVACLGHGYSLACIANG